MSERVGLGFRGGLAIVAHASRWRSSTEPLDAAGELYRRDIRGDSSCTWIGAAVGVDVPVRLTEHAALVPSARVILFVPYEPDPCIIRSGVGLRWTF